MREVDGRGIGRDNSLQDTWKDNSLQTPAMALLKQEKVKRFDVKDSSYQVSNESSISLEMPTSQASKAVRMLTVISV